MSAEAVATLRRLWEKLSTHKVARVIAKEPEDILHIEIVRDSGHTDRYIEPKRTKDIPEEDRHRARVVWRHYYGFTEDNVYFHNDDYCGLDVDVDMTLDFSGWMNHKSGWSKKPNPGDVVMGEVVDMPKGKRLTPWFIARPEVQLFIKICLEGKTDLSDDELGRRLLTPGFPDQYWALARLILFDNVQVFVDAMKYGLRGESDPRPLHPAHGLPSGTVMPSGKVLTVDHRGMWTCPAIPKFIHQLGYRLNEPTWFETYKKLTAEQGLSYEHDALGGWCAACHADLRDNQWITGY